MSERATQAAEPAQARTAELELFIEREFDAPREMVFRAWTEPEQLAQWCMPRGFTLPLNEGEIRPGGAWRTILRGPDGQEYRVGGVYREVVPPARLVFTHRWEDDAPHETVVTLEFHDLGGRTRLTLHQAFFHTAANRDGHGAGWGETLDGLAVYLRAIA